MTTKKWPLPLLVFTLACTASVSQAADNQPLKRNDPKRPVDKIAAELNIEAEQFVACFMDVNPAPQGTTPTKAHERANKAILLPCLQSANPNITNDLLDEVMDRYRLS